MGGYLSRKEEEGKEKGQNKKKRGGRKGVARVLIEQTGGVVKVYGVSSVDSLLVLKRTGSMYFDEDGDLAHEFYCEERMKTRLGEVMWTMRRITDHLRPQGEVKLPFPRLHIDFPLLLVDSTVMIVAVHGYRTTAQQTC